MQRGFGSSPVTKGIIVSTVVASGLLHVRDPAGNFNVTLDIWRVLTEGELWRLVSCHTVCTSMGTLVATCLSLYRLRVLEPLLGSRKFGALATVTSVMSLPLEATAAVNFDMVRLTPGPLPVVFALLVMYYATVPPLKRRQFGVLGMDFSDKALTFCIAGMLACCEGWNSVVPAVCGAFVGGMYLVDTVSIQSVRLPKFIYRCCSKLCLPLLGISRRPTNGSPPGHARGSASRRPRPAAPSSFTSGGSGGGGLMSFFNPRQGAPRLRFPSQQQPVPPPSEETVSSLTGMGFDRPAVLQALQHTGNDASAAANVLLSGAGTRGLGTGGGDPAVPGGGGGGPGSSGRQPPISGTGGGNESGSPPQHHHSN